MTERLWDVLVPKVWRRAARRPHTPREDIQEKERAGDLPAAKVARRRSAPDVSRKCRSGAADLAGDLNDGLRRDAALALGELKCVMRVGFFQDGQEGIDCRRDIR